MIMTVQIYSVSQIRKSTSKCKKRSAWSLNKVKEVVNTLLLKVEVLPIQSG